LPECPPPQARQTATATGDPRIVQRPHSTDAHSLEGWRLAGRRSVAAAANRSDMVQARAAPLNRTMTRAGRHSLGPTQRSRGRQNHLLVEGRP
jgi:hypothetical protein